MKIRSSTLDTISHPERPAAPDSIEATLSPPGSGPAPELARRLSADMQRVFSVAETGDGRRVICRLLHQSLADCIDLEGQCRQARWNLRGSDAAAFRPWFDQVEDMATAQSERLAAHIVELGNSVHASIPVVAERSGLKECPANSEDVWAHVDAVVSGLELLATVLPGDAEWLAEHGDAYTQTLLTEMKGAIDAQLQRVPTRRAASQ